jgi:putative ABC transport system ATP-binding protein
MNRDSGLGPGASGFATEGPFPSPEPLGPRPFLSLRDLEKSFPQADGRLYVLRRISLDVAAGDFVTIMGPSGAGKSTLLAVLGMLDGDWTGEYRLLDKPVHTLKHKDRIALGKQYVGFVFQQYHLIDDLTVAENLAMPLSYRDVKPDDREAAVADTLDRFGMVAKKNLYRESPFESGERHHDAVPRAERRRHDDRAGHALRRQRHLREARDPATRWLGGELTWTLSSRTFATRCAVC